MKLTKDEAIERHRKLWEELARSGASFKPATEATNDCWLCEYGFQMNASDPCCILYWPKIKEMMKKKYRPPCCKSYYGVWREARNIKERRCLAKIIAELEED